jgi:CBS domain-containing protein
MTRDPRTVEIGDSLADAAREMRDGDVANVIVTDGEAEALTMGENSIRRLPVVSHQRQPDD